MRVPILVLLLLAASGAAGSQPADPESKIQPSARRELARGRATSAIDVYFNDGVSFAEARDAILASGGALANVLEIDFGVMRHISARVASPSLTALAADERVRMIAGPRPFRLKTDNAISAAVSHVTELQAAPYGLTGAGVNVSLFELAAGQASHPEFGGRLTVFTTGGATSWQTHATHVAGTIGAGGVNASAKGMAPGATISQFLAALDNDGHPLYYPAKNDLGARGVAADNNSWGLTLGWSFSSTWIWEDNAEYFGAYDFEFTAPLDQISRNRNVLFVHSSGNEGDDGPTGTWGEHRHRDAGTPTFCYSQNGSGTDCPVTCLGGCEATHHHTLEPYDTLGLTAAAKNVLTVGAVSTTKEILSLSSRGPTKDGRIKPEVVARGASVLSSVPTNSYGTATGTSMASPVVTGVAALLTEQWKRTFATMPKPEELKAVIIAGAEDLGNPGPDYTYGFGLVNAKASADLIIADHADHKYIRSTTITQGQQYEMPVVVQTAQNVRVVLQWPDPEVLLSESQGYTAKALVNNLDLKLVGPTGTVYSPYVLDKSNPGAVATRGVNTIDNTEMVEITNAAPGAYRIVVNGTNVPQSPQNATIVTTARAARPCQDVQEPNNTPETAFGPIVTNATINAGFCSEGDIDRFKWVLTRNATSLVVIDNTGDTPLHANLSGAGQFAVLDIPAYSSGSVPLGSKVPGTEIRLTIEPLGPLGVEPVYSFKALFSSDPGVRRRAARH